MTEETYHEHLETIETAIGPLLPTIGRAYADALTEAGVGDPFAEFQLVPMHDIDGSGTVYISGGFGKDARMAFFVTARSDKHPAMVHLDAPEDAIAALTHHVGLLTTQASDIVRVFGEVLQRMRPSVPPMPMTLEVNAGDQDWHITVE